MKYVLFTFVMLALNSWVQAQDIYFPPNIGEWETTSPEELGWCTDSLVAFELFLDEQHSKSFILLKDGKIVLEYYFDEFTQDSLWYWASGGKSLEAFLIGCAQEDGFLDINQPTSDFLGAGWTSLSPEQEAEIGILNQLTMTSGLDDGVVNSDCTDPECLEFLAAPRERWAYHNAPYTLLSDVLENAVGLSPNLYILSRLTTPTGIDVYYVPLDYNKVAFSTPRNMAKFGLLIMNRGEWGTNAILSDLDYINNMLSPSQELNPAYGYLWWLNGQSSYMLPGLQLNLPGSLVPEAPENMVAAIGRNAQIINVVEEEGLVWIRMGEASTFDLVPTALNNEIWTYLNQIICSTNAVEEKEELLFSFGPNPCENILHCQGSYSGDILLLDAMGRTIKRNQVQAHVPIDINTGDLDRGVYFLKYYGMELLSSQLLILK